MFVLYMSRMYVCNMPEVYSDRGGRGPHIPNGGRGHLDRRGGTWLQGHLPGDLLVLVARKTLGLSGYESPLRQSLAVPSWAFELGLANTS